MTDWADEKARALAFRYAAEGYEWALEQGIAKALREAERRGMERAAKIVDAFEERRWRTLGQGGDLSACSLPNISKAIREQSGEEDDV